MLSFKLTKSGGSCDWTGDLVGIRGSNILNFRGRDQTWKAGGGNSATKNCLGVFGKGVRIKKLHFLVKGCCLSAKASHQH